MDKKTEKVKRRFVQVPKAHLSDLEKYTSYYCLITVEILGPKLEDIQKIKSSV